MAKLKLPVKILLIVASVAVLLGATGALIFALMAKPNDTDQPLKIVLSTQTPNITESDETKLTAEITGGAGEELKYAEATSESPAYEFSSSCTEPDIYINGEVYYDARMCMEAFTTVSTPVTYKLEISPKVKKNRTNPSPNLKKGKNIIYVVWKDATSNQVVVNMR